MEKCERIFFLIIIDENYCVLLTIINDYLVCVKIEKNYEI